jgi:hypothetical protein
MNAKPGFRRWPPEEAEAQQAKCPTPLFVLGLPTKTPQEPLLVHVQGTWTSPRQIREAETGPYTYEKEASHKPLAQRTRALKDDLFQEQAKGQRKRRSLLHRCVKLIRLQEPNDSWVLNG